jgi:pilus assembly protein CpaF
MSISTDAYAEIRNDVLRAIEREQFDPGAEPGEIRRIVEAAVDAYQTHAHLGRSRALHDPAGMASRILTSITDFGPLTDLLARSDVEEVFIEGSRVTHLDDSGRLQGLSTPTTEEENRQIVDRLLAASQRTLDAANPLVQARVLDGTARLTAAIPPVTDRLSATLRRQVLRRETLRTLVSRGSLSVPAAGFLAAAMRTSTNVVVSGPPGAGKTSLLSAMLAAVPATHCVRACEEIRELHVPLTHGGYYETRPAVLDGGGEISLRELVKFVLAMRPDRIVIGEVRGAESFELTRAVNAGCGFMCTVHANSARDALVALVNAAIMAGENVTERIVRRVFAGAIDILVHCDRDLRTDVDGVRREVTEILAVVPSLHDDFTTEPIFVREAPGRPLTWTGTFPPVGERIERTFPGSTGLRQVLDGRRSLL